MTIENRFGLGREAVVDACAEQRAAATDAFRIDMHFVIGVTGVLQRADDRAGGGTARCTYTGTDDGRREPAGRDDRSQTRDGEQAETSEQTGRATQTSEEATA